MLGEPIGRDEVSTAMSEFRPSNDVPPPGAAARCSGVRDRMLIGLMLFTLVRTSEALAGDQASIANATLDSGAGGLRQPLPPAPALMASPALMAPPELMAPLESFSAPTDMGIRTFSATEFRPRRPTVFDSDSTVSAFGDTSLLRNTTVWQRLSEYRSRDRVRLLTLWESSSSTISLQAGRRGDPSLQWTSRLMNRGGSTEGVLDRLFSTSLARAGMGLRNLSRPANVPALPAPKPAGVAETAGLK
jgi:hypothetical protein